MTASQAESAARALVSAWMAELRDARISAGISQSDVASAMEVRRLTVLEWENGQRFPALEHLLQFGRELGLRLVVEGGGAQAFDGLAEIVAGESWVRGEIRRICAALRRARRTGHRQSQAAVAKVVGVSLWSLANYERCQVNPRVIVLARWVRAVGCGARWQPIV